MTDRVNIRLTGDHDYPVRTRKDGLATKTLAYKKGWEGPVPQSHADHIIAAGKGELVDAPADPATTEGADASTTEGAGKGGKGGKAST